MNTRLSGSMAGLRTLLDRLSGARAVGTVPVELLRVHTDTRTLQPGDLFVALKGETFDANAFLPQAAQAGATAAIAHSGLAAAGLAGVEVPDTRAALGQLAAMWRAQFNLPLVAVTGSNGKTTVTQMVASILRAAVGGDGADALATQGNLNNDIGVPQTLLRLRAHHQWAVVELGMNHPGEIAGLAAMAAPTVALVNNAQREHQEFMGTVEAVARENGQAIAALSPQGVAVFPSDDTYTHIWRELAGARRVLTFSDTDATADVRATATWQGLEWRMQLVTPAGASELTLASAGRHNVRNALAACACALAAGVSLTAVVQGLQAFEPVKGRSRALSVTTPNGALTLVDDTYNANPDSVRAAIDVLAELPAPRLLVLGDMGEVGNQGPEFHAEVGTYAAERGIEALFTLGDLCVHSAQAFGVARHFADMDSLLLATTGSLGEFRSVVVKGSRFMKMERVVQALQSHSDNQNSQNKDKIGEPHAA
jgi:UDP-N-acetylmuramoyl-tripeptide--D-alanyl-D-alanine ligase